MQLPIQRGATTKHVQLPQTLGDLLRLAQARPQLRVQKTAVKHTHFSRADLTITYAEEMGLAN
jgi:hypothetical protein